MEGHSEGNPEEKIVKSGVFAGWPEKEVHKMGEDAAEDIKLIRASWKVLSEDDTAIGFQTDAGVFVENKKTGQLTRVGEKATVKREEAKAGK